METMDDEQYEKKTLEAVLESARTLATADEFSEELIALAEENKGTLTYYDTDNVDWDVKGYDFVFFDEEGNLSHAKLVPSELGILGDIHERESVEEMLEGHGFTLDESETFRAALHRQLN
jgi:hypothetical protein